MNGRSLTSLRVAELVPSEIRRIVALAGEIPDVVNLSEGQPDFATPPHVVEAATEAIRYGHTSYTPTLGIPELREAIADKARTENSLPAEANWVAVTVGAMEGLLLSMLVTLDPGDHVLVPDPGYPYFPGHARLVSAVPVPYPLEPPDFQLDVDALRRSVTPRTRALLLCTPSNPTGGVLRRDTLEQVAEVAMEHGLVVLADETYEAFVYDGAGHTSIGSLPGMAERTISLFSFSKTYAMTGWRLGYLVASPELVRRMNMVQEHLVLCPSSVSQYAGLAALRGPQDTVRAMLRVYDERRRYVASALDAIPGISCPAPHGAFYAFPNLRDLETPVDELAETLLREARVATVPGSAFGSRGQGFVRISYTVRLERLREAVHRIQPLLTSAGERPRGTLR